jgi:amino acid permease
VLLVSPIIAATAEPENGGESNGFLKFFASFITIPVYFLVFIAYKFTNKTKLVPLKMVDIRSGNINVHPELEGEIEDETEKSGWERFLGYLN